MLLSTRVREAKNHLKLRDDARVTGVAVGNELDQEGTLVAGDPLLRPLRCLVDGDDVHTVHLDTGDLVATGVVLRVRGAALRGRTHTVLVVLADEDARQVPELGLQKRSVRVPSPLKSQMTHHVVRLKHLTLVARTVTVHGERGGLFALVLLGERETRTERDLRADDTMTTLEGLGEDVHGSTLALRDTAHATEQLADEALKRTSTEKDEGMRAVRRDDLVLERRGRVDTDGDRFLHAKTDTKHPRKALPWHRRRT